MIHSQRLITLFLVSLIAACGGGGSSADVPKAQPAGATNAVIGDHVVHFSALSTEQLPAEIAKTYDIVRSKNRAMVNLSILGLEDNKAVPADIEVKTSNLTGQVKNVTMRRINEGDAIYYIGVTQVANHETLIFDISIRPEGTTTNHSVKFQRQFYTD